MQGEHKLSNVIFVDFRISKSCYWKQLRLRHICVFHESPLPVNIFFYKSHVAVAVGMSRYCLEHQNCPHVDIWRASLLVCRFATNSRLLCRAAFLLLKTAIFILRGESFSRCVRTAVSYPKTKLQLYIPTLFMRWAGHVACMGDRRGVYRVLVGKLEGKRTLGRPRRSWEDNIKMNIREVGCGIMDWIQLAQNRDRWRALVNALIFLRVS